MSKISEQRRQEILDAAQTEFSLGIEQASMSGIAARAGIGKSTIYEYFPSKGELLIEVCKRYIHRLEQQVEEALEQDGLVMRTVIPDTPPRTEYRLTERGKSIIPLLNQVYDWGWHVMQEEGLPIDALGEMWHGYREKEDEIMDRPFGKNRSLE